jgi:hypothetical protein
MQRTPAADKFSYVIIQKAGHARAQAKVHGEPADSWVAETREERGGEGKSLLHTLLGLVEQGGREVRAKRQPNNPSPTPTSNSLCVCVSVCLSVCLPGPKIGVAPLHRPVLFLSLISPPLT